MQVKKKDKFEIYVNYVSEQTIKTIVNTKKCEAITNSCTHAVWQESANEDVEITTTLPDKHVNLTTKVIVNNRSQIQNEQRLNISNKIRINVGKSKMRCAHNNSFDVMMTTETLRKNALTQIGHTHQDVLGGRLQRLPGKSWRLLTAAICMLEII